MASSERGLRWAGRGWVALSIVVLTVFSVLRLFLPTQGPAPDFWQRYLAQPLLTALHIGPGLAYLLLAPLQFVAALRQRRPAWHRALGRTLIVLGAVSGMTGIAAAFVLPAYGGIGTTLATLVFGTAFLCCLGRAGWLAHERRFAPHREYMIRAFALGLGVATIRLVIVLLEVVTGAPMREVFALAFWLGFGANALAAEWWIRRTRRGLIS